VNEAQFSALIGLLDEILGELKSRASVQQGKVEIKTSTRGADVTVTAYTTTVPDELSTAGLLAIAEYRRVMHELSAEAMASFVTEANRVGANR
jgi:hypothetical protein